MRRHVLLKVGLVAALAAGLRVDSADGLRLTGAGPADAKDFYTKKRVNGRWISGRFPKRSAARAGTPDHDTTASRVPGSNRATVTARVATAGAPTSPMAAAAPVAAGAAAASSSEVERLDKLRQALQARVNALTTGSVVPHGSPRPAPEPHSVSLDFQSGIKTTLFSDGMIVREPFDVPALKSLAATPREGNERR
jgi:hypothetical protein